MSAAIPVPGAAQSKAAIRCADSKTARWAGSQTIYVYQAILSGIGWGTNSPPQFYSTFSDAITAAKNAFALLDIASANPVVGDPSVVWNSSNGSPMTNVYFYNIVFGYWDSGGVYQGKWTGDPSMVLNTAEAFGASLWPHYNFSSPPIKGMFSGLLADYGSSLVYGAMTYVLGPAAIYNSYAPGSSGFFGASMARTVASVGGVSLPAVFPKIGIPACNPPDPGSRSPLNQWFWDGEYQWLTSPLLDI